MLINECKPEFQFKKSSKNAKFGQCLYLVAHLCYEQNRCAERTVTFTAKLPEAFLFQVPNSFGIFLISFAILKNPFANPLKKVANLLMEFAMFLS